MFSSLPPLIYILLITICVVTLIYESAKSSKKSKLEFSIMIISGLSGIFAALSKIVQVYLISYVSLKDIFSNVSIIMGMICILILIVAPPQKKLNREENRSMIWSSVILSFIVCILLFLYLKY